MGHIIVLALCSIFAIGSFLPLHCMQAESLDEQLLRVIGKSDTQAIELLARGANVHARTKAGLTPLHYAVTYGSNKLIEILMERANINASDQLGRTPLHLAARFGKMDAAALLLAAGADVRLRDKEGNTPEQTAIESGFSNIAKLLARIK